MGDTRQLLLICDGAVAEDNEIWSWSSSVWCSGAAGALYFGSVWKDFLRFYMQRVRPPFFDLAQEAAQRARDERLDDRPAVVVEQVDLVRVGLGCSGVRVFDLCLHTTLLSTKVRSAPWGSRG